MEDKVKQMYTEYTYPKYTEYMDKFAPIPHQYNPYLFLEQINHYIYKGNKKNFNYYNILGAGVGLRSDIINMGFFFKEYETDKSKISYEGIIPITPLKFEFIALSSLIRGIAGGSFEFEFIGKMVN